MAAAQGKPRGGAVMDLRTGKWKMASTPIFPPPHCIFRVNSQRLSACIAKNRELSVYQLSKSRGSYDITNMNNYCTLTTVYCYKGPAFIRSYAATQKLSN